MKENKIGDTPVQKIRDFLENEDVKNLYRRNYDTEFLKEADNFFLDENVIIDLRQKRFKGSDNVLFSWETSLDMFESARKYNPETEFIFQEDLYRKNSERNISENEKGRSERFLELLEALGKTVRLDELEHLLHKNNELYEDLKIAKYASETNSVIVTRDNDFINQPRDPGIKSFLEDQTPEEYFDIAVAPPPVIHAGYCKLEKESGTTRIEFRDVLENTDPYIK